MRIFEQFPTTSICPVCGTNANTTTLLVPIDDSKQNDGFTTEAIPTHLECITNNIRYSKSHKLMGLEATKTVEDADLDADI